MLKPLLIVPDYKWYTVHIIYLQLLKQIISPVCVCTCELACVCVCVCVCACVHTCVQMLACIWVLGWCVCTFTYICTPGYVRLCAHLQSIYTCVHIQHMCITACHLLPIFIRIICPLPAPPHPLTTPQPQPWLVFKTILLFFNQQWSLYISTDDAQALEWWQLCQHDHEAPSLRLLPPQDRCGRGHHAGAHPGDPVRGHLPRRPEDAADGPEPPHPHAVLRRPWAEDVHPGGHQGPAGYGHLRQGICRWDARPVSGRWPWSQVRICVCVCVGGGGVAGGEG